MSLCFGDQEEIRADRTEHEDAVIWKRVCSFFQKWPLSPFLYSGAALGHLRMGNVVQTRRSFVNGCIAHHLKLGRSHIFATSQIQDFHLGLLWTIS